ncbi:MAG: glycosyltransferase family 4 protein [Dysosmobacter sp.]|jgi:glycosyltransferase involved in cell wall biosynthesis|uniref:glycosyltransferase family 4 protein n=1 Tax=Dysosmobacter sp. TaxID=2591382 RepID=UPI003D904FE7
MKILVITNHSYMFWRFRRELMVRLLEEHEVVLSTPFVGHEEDLRALGCRLVETEVDRRGINPVTDSKLIRAYAALLKQERPDLVITYSIKPNIYAGFLCRVKNIPYCVNVQGLGTAFQKKGLAQLVTIMYRHAVKKAGTVFFENEGNAALFRARHITPAGQQTVLHGAGINLDDYPCRPYPQRDVIRFLYVGRIMREKGVEELFYAIRNLHEKYGQKVVLDLVGFFEDGYKDQVEALKREGIATFYGFQEDPRTFYEQADCIVLPSYHEGMSNVLLEGAATGRALIASDIPGCREAVEDGISGYLCRVKDREALLEAMERFVACDPQKRACMGQHGRERMERLFSRKQVVEKTVRAILEGFAC